MARGRIPEPHLLASGAQRDGLSGPGCKVWGVLFRSLYTSRLVLAASLALAGVAGRADEEARVAAVSASFAGHDLRVSARLEPLLPGEVARRLVSGLPTTAVWEIGLFVVRPLWPDGKKDERRYEVTATYRPAGGDFSVERRLDGRLLETRIAPTREEAALALSRVPELPSFTMGDHLFGKRLYVRVRCAWEVGLALGVVPTTERTDWARSAPFSWTAGGPR